MFKVLAGVVGVVGERKLVPGAKIEVVLLWVAPAR